MKSNLADLNVDLQGRGYQWQTQWKKGSAANPAERQDIAFYGGRLPTRCRAFFNASAPSEPSSICPTTEPELERRSRASRVAATDRDAANQMYVRMRRPVRETRITLYTQVYTDDARSVRDS